jgi:hypothetical protein
MSLIALLYVSMRDRVQWRPCMGLPLWRRRRHGGNDGGAVVLKVIDSLAVLSVQSTVVVCDKPPASLVVVTTELDDGFFVENKARTGGVGRPAHVLRS